MQRTPYFMPEVQLAFMRNTITGESFIAPALGVTETAATANLRATYPSAVYSLQAIYPAADVQRYLTELDRWPGLPSKAQPSLTDLMATQRVKISMQGLPPLPSRNANQPVAAAGLNAAQVQQVRTIAKGMPAETQALAARLLASGVTAAPEVTQPLPTSHPFAPRPTAAPTAAAPTLKEALAAMRGIQGLGATVQHSATPATTPLAQPISRMPQAAVPAATAPGYTLSAAALPPSARGTLREDLAISAIEQTMADGKNSVIHRLRAWRGQS